MSVPARKIVMADGFSKNPEYKVDLAKAQLRIRVEFGGEIVADSTNAIVLNETRLAPTYYFPKEDVHFDLLHETTYRTHCPFKGNASYWSVKAGGKIAENAVWSYEDPLPEVSEIGGYVAFYQDRMDAWYEGDDEIEGVVSTGQTISSNPMVDWLLREAWEATTTRELVSRFAHHLNELGVSVLRVNVLIQTLHPLLLANGYRWEREVDEVVRFDAPHDSINADIYLLSPMKMVLEGEGGVRRKVNAETALEFPIIKDLNDQGATDYVALPMRFSNGQINALTLATDAPGGFSTEILGHIHDILPVMTRLLEVHAKERMAATLMHTFIGEHTGDRVLNGLVKRGDSEDLHAVIWFCDLRNSTPLAETLSRQEFLDYLNRYFDCMAGAVVDNGGEVLRFIGDAALAIFPIEDRSGGRGCCNGADTATKQALKAARYAEQLVREANEELVKTGSPKIQFGIGLHIGDVTYGNIGIPERLEFTVIGSAVNQAARIEGMSKELGTSVIASKAFADHYKGELKSLGVHELRGVDGSHELFSI
jgi:adenylate cyclase